MIGLPPSLVEIYGNDIKTVKSAFIHLLFMCTIIYIVAPITFGAALPASLPLYFASLSIFIVISLSIGSVLGLLFKSQAKLTMISQIIVIPSIMLLGIMFPVDLLPNFLSLLEKYSLQLGDID